MKILSFNWHTPYLAMLANLDHSFDIAPPNTGRDLPLKPWHETMRPLASNVTPITTEQALERLRYKDSYDLILAHNTGDLVFTRDFSLPKILVFHNKLSTEAELSRKPERIPAYREWVHSLISGVYCVFISQTKRYDWDLPGDIIMPGIDISLYGGYSGQITRALRVGNDIKARDRMTGYSIQEKALEGLQNILIGENPDIPDCRISRDWEELKQAYRENRLFLNTSSHPWEDGYNLAMLEAMATGMPIVSLANPTSPLNHGRDGLVSEDASGLRRKIEQLLGDIDLAGTIGAEGRRTAERLFPFTRFLENWDETIKRAHAWHPHKPRQIFVPAEKKEAGPVPRIKTRPDVRNIILSYTSNPTTAAFFFDRAFKQKHNVLTVGSKLNQYIKNAWDLHTLKEEVKPHDIDTPNLAVSVDHMLARIPDDFNPDFFLWIETGLGLAPEGLDKLSIPKAAYLIDTHFHLQQHIEIAKEFDVVFVAQRAYIPEFEKHGIRKVHWLPLGCDPEIHGKIPIRKEFEIGFVGTVNDQRRITLLQRLSEKVDVRYKRAFLQEMTEHFCRSRIVFNNAVRKDLNMRVFEALCSGSMLLTDYADGINDFFQHRKHLVIYNDEDIADIASYYLSHETEREEIAETGRREVLKRHTYNNRADEIVKVMTEVSG